MPELDQLKKDNTPMQKNKFFLILVAFLILAPGLASAHQPRITTGAETIVTDPEISKAYYAKLVGEPQVYYIHSVQPFDLYVNILVPDIVGQKKDVNLALFKKGNPDELLIVFDEGNNNWKKFFEPFGYDSYWQGAEFRTRATAGDYLIRVWSSNNDSKYSLAIGETEAFSLRETINAISLIPEIKRNFFNEMPINFIFSPLGWGSILVMYLLAFVVGFIIRLLSKKFSARRVNKKGRLIWAIVGVVLLILTIATSWNFILLFLSGFCIFQALFLCKR